MKFSYSRVQVKLLDSKFTENEKKNKIGFRFEIDMVGMKGGFS